MNQYPSLGGFRGLSALAVAVILAVAGCRSSPRDPEETIIQPSPETIIQLSPSAPVTPKARLWLARDSIVGMEVFRGVIAPVGEPGVTIVYRTSYARADSAAFRRDTEWRLAPEYELSRDEGAVPMFRWMAVIPCYRDTPCSLSDERGKEVREPRLLFRPATQPPPT